MSPVLASHSARRCLFGKPDSEEVNQWLHGKLEKMETNATLKYNFDFANDRPLKPTEKDEFSFTAIKPSEVPALYHDVKVTRSGKRVPVYDASVASFSANEVILPETETDLAARASPTKDTPIKTGPVTRSHSTAREECSSSKAFTVVSPLKRSRAVTATAAEKPRLLKQAKLTNYIPIRKCRVAAKKLFQNAENSAAQPPNSPFRFATNADESLVDSGSSPLPSPLKTPRKRGASRPSSRVGIQTTENGTPRKKEPLTETRSLRSRAER